MGLTVSARPVRRTAQALWWLARDALDSWRTDQGPFLSAAIAYYAVFSIVPLMVIIVAAAGALFGPEVARTSLATQLERVLGTSPTAFVIGLIDRAESDRSGIAATAAGLLMLVYGASGVFGRLRAALNVIWDVQPPPRHPVIGFLRDRLVPFVMVAIAAALVVVSLVLGAALSVLRADLEAAVPLEGRGIGIGVPEQLPVPNLGLNVPTIASSLEPLLAAVRSLQFADFAASFLLSGVLFALVFRFVPDTSVAWRDVWLGASLGGLLFGVGKLAMQLYLAKARVVTTYGAAGSLVVILLMANYSAQVLFVGAELTKAYAYRYGSRAGSEPGHLTGASSLAPASSSQP